MANTTEELIHQMYDTQLASQKEQLTNNFNTANSELDVQKQKNQKAADTNLNRTAVESQKATVNDAEYYAAAGLTSGARAQARLARENQLQSNLTAIRTAQQEADAETERQRSLLAQEYASAIRKAQADNDFQKAQALYDEAKRQDDRLLQQNIAAADILGAAGDFSLHGAAYGMTEDQTAGLKAEYDRQAAEEAAAKAEAERQQKQAEQAAMAEILAAAGDFSGYSGLYGITPEQAAAMQGKYDSEAEKAASDTANAEKQAISEAAAKLMAQGGDFSRLGALYGLTEEEIALLNSLYASGNGGDTGAGGDTGTGAGAGDDTGTGGDTGLGEERKDEIQDWVTKYIIDKIPDGEELPYWYKPKDVINNASNFTSDEEREYAWEVFNKFVPQPNNNPGTGNQLFQNSTDFDNGTLTKDQIEEMQRYFGVANVDGLWGNQSAAAAGNRTAKEAWDYYQQNKGGNELGQERKDQIQDWVTKYIIDKIPDGEELPYWYKPEDVINNASEFKTPAERQYALLVLNEILPLR